MPKNMYKISVIFVSIRRSTGINTCTSSNAYIVFVILRLTVGQDDTQNYKKAPEKQLFFRGQFYFATEGQPNFALGGQLRLPSGVKRARLFQYALF